MVVEMVDESNTTKLDRKTLERNRRLEMKGLCFKLASLIPLHHLNHRPKESLTQQDQVDLAEAYIRKLTARIEKLKRRKERASNTNSELVNNTNIVPDQAETMMRFPVIELKELESGIEVILITGLRRKFTLHQVILVLDQEGAEVITANLYTVGDKVFHTLHAQVKLSRVGIEITSVSQRLQNLIY